MDTTQLAKKIEKLWLERDKKLGEAHVLAVIGSQLGRLMNHYQRYLKEHQDVDIELYVGNLILSTIAYSNLMKLDLDACINKALYKNRKAREETRVREWLETLRD
ncbi:MAG: hypothetical protein JW834_01860 [Candidatus Diapherotrites archaeon]|nr:hypothetical protein [Candidatus Diapherotrites archaeon]